MIFSNLFVLKREMWESLSFFFHGQADILKVSWKKLMFLSIQILKFVLVVIPPAGQ